MRGLTLSEAASRLRLSPKTLYNRLSRDQAEELRAVKVYGRWRIPEEAVEDIVANGTILYEFGGEIPKNVRFARRQSFGPLSRLVYKKLLVLPRAQAEKMMRLTSF